MEDSSREKAARPAAVERPVDAGWTPMVKAPAVPAAARKTAREETFMVGRILGGALWNTDVGELWQYLALNCVR